MILIRHEGPHKFWLGESSKESSTNPNLQMNFLHYDDAADATIQAFESKGTK